MKPPVPSKELLESIAWHQDEARKMFRTSLLLHYVFEPEDAKADSCQFLIPARLVYRQVADDFAIPVIPKMFQTWVITAVEECGGIHYRYNGYAFFRGIRRTDTCVEASKELTEQYKREARFAKSYRPMVLGYQKDTTIRHTSLTSWEKLLADEGMPRELAGLGLIDPQRAVLNRARIERATSAMWRVYRDFAILRLYLDGLSIIGIATKLNIGRKIVWNRLKHYDLSMSEK